MLGIKVAPWSAAAGTVNRGLKVDAVPLTVAAGELVTEGGTAPVVAPMTLWPPDPGVVVSTLGL